MKKLPIVLVLLLTFLLVGCGKEEESIPLDGLTRQINILNEDVSSDIAVLGDDSLLDSRLRRRKIFSIDETSLPISREYGYQALVILDLDSTIVLTDKDFDFLEDYIINKDKDVIYIGTQYLDRFSEMFKIEMREEDCGIGMYGCFPDDMSVTGVGICSGVWTTDDISRMEDNLSVLSEAVVSELSSNATGDSYDY